MRVSGNRCGHRTEGQALSRCTPLAPIALMAGAGQALGAVACIK
jgi:hypothetical protein